MKEEYVSAEQTAMPVFSGGDEVSFKQCDNAHWRTGKVLAYVDPGNESEGYYRITDGGKIYSIPSSQVTYKKHKKRGW